MTTSTHRIAIDVGRYVNVSNGNLNCTLVTRYPQQVRVHFGGEEPAPDTEEYVPIINAGAGKPCIVSVADLAAESDVWVRSEADVDSLIVIRGEAKIMVT